LMDPSRNMSKYRNLFTGERSYPPIIPWFPIVKKDITFLHLGNDTHVDGLVNFEKLRMIAREVRRICKFCAIGYDPQKMDSMQDNLNESSNVALSVVSITGPNNRRSGRGSIAMTNPKKAYEEYQTSRRIRQYLERLSAKQYTEKELQELSYNCEPPPSAQTPTSNQRTNKKYSSPTTDKRASDRTLSTRPSNASLNSNRETSTPPSTPSSRTKNPSTLAQTPTDDTRGRTDTFPSPRKRLPLPSQSSEDLPHRPFLYSDSSSNISSNNGSLKSVTSTGSRTYPTYAEYVETDLQSHFDDDDHGQVSMV